MPPPTVISRKQAFIERQTRLLSRPLEPSQAWNAGNEEADERLPAAVVKDVLFKLNHKIQQHERRVHAPQATRHVAEQIDQLYWSNAERVAGRYAAGDAVPEALVVGVDLTNPEILTDLPPTWPSAREVDAYPPEAQRYERLASELQDLHARRQAAAARVARVRRMHALLEPFAGPASVQPNLVTRDGEVERELERMKFLLARVGGRIEELPDAEAEEHAEDAVHAPFGADAGAADSALEGRMMLYDAIDADARWKVQQLANEHGDD